VRSGHGHGKLIYQAMGASKLPKDQVEDYYNSFSLIDVDKHLDIIEIIFYEMRRLQLHHQKKRKYFRPI
jgi:hypothetical protein